MLLSSCDLPSQKEGKQTPLPFIILAEDGQSVTDAWKSIEGDTITTGRFNPGIKLNRWWVKTQVKNNSKFEDEFFLVLNNPHINMIEVYINGNNHPALITGDRFAFDSRQYPSRDFVFPFELKSGESKEVLMILDKRGETFHIDPELLNEGEYDDRRRNEHLIMGVVSGWMALIIVITLFFWSELRHRSAFYYAIFVLSVFLWIFSHWGMGFQYLWPESVTWVGKSRPVFNLASNVALMLTIINFFPPTSSRKHWKILFRGLIWINGLLLIAFLIIPESNVKPEIIAFFLKTVLVLSAIQILSILSYLIVQYLAKTKFAGYYLAGISFLYSFSILIYLDQVSGSLQLSHYLLNFGSAFGTMGETGLITFAYMRQASLEKKEKEKLALEILKKEKDYADQIILAQEEERNRLGRDLHDSIGGMLGTLHMRLQGLRLKTQDPELQAIQVLVHQGIQETRTLSHNLTPPHLDELGLVKALANEVELLNQEVSVKVLFYHKLETEIPKATEVMVYRIVIELISNSLKHAEASEIAIQLISDPEKLELIVEDDGKGFSDEQKIRGLGLNNINSRVNYLKGELTIDSNSNGTTTLITIPN
ncbi:sensor histidine kinase [Algoriphagus boritolerans]|nr:7TM diverse intracellular signaling domain-containing protein [Algoriphagus boritolerans]